MVGSRAAMNEDPISDWRRLTGADFARLRGQPTVALVSCSPLEVHGPHLPVIADIAEAEMLLDAAARRVAEARPGLRFVKLPAVYAAADVLPHRGSIRFRTSTITRMLEDLGVSLATQGFDTLWVSNFHGGPRHIVAIEEACARVMRRCPGAKMVPVFSLLLGRLTGGSSDASHILAEPMGLDVRALLGDVHGGAVETSLLLHGLGDWVSAQYATLPRRSLEDELARNGQAPLNRGPRPTFFEIVRSFPLRYRYFERETYAGDPSLASAARGARVLDTLSTLTAEAMLEVLDGKIAPSAWHSPLWRLRHLLLSERFGALADWVLSTRAPGV